MNLIARVLQQGSPRKGKVKGRKAAAAARGSSSSSSAAALDYGHRRKSLVPDWGMAMDFSTIFRRKERQVSVKDSLAVVGLKKALLIGERGRFNALAPAMYYVDRVDIPLEMEQWAKRAALARASHSASVFFSFPL